jgi:hypothetical protein
MDARSLFVLVLAVSLLNGLLSPAVTLLVILSPIWMPFFVPLQAETAFYGASLIVAFGTLLCAGIPAALYERLSGSLETTPISGLIWLGTAILLTLPVLQRFT